MGGTHVSAGDDLSEIASEPDPWDTDEPNRARILWVKNLTRLRQQVSYLHTGIWFVINFVATDSCY